MDDDASGFDPRRFVSAMTRAGHNGALGIRYVAHGEDWAELALDYDPRMIGDPASGVIASGPILTLMDMATSMGIWIRSRRFRAQATLDLRVDYLRPATPERTVIGRGQCYRITRSVAFIRGQAHDGNPDDPIAHVAGTYMFIDTGQ
ncbi:MAG: phenylacetic acid degradation protein [Sphingomonas sp. SCN 67-18]|uniref:PaaI family thioesterase n=1 Tax=uncultured Sphingomonas sp. TaxID=158754 RepID=UPI00086D134D|nr:PaaI family thioesterase [Sphingomonas sp. SCN 67-18]ODU22068.1 MAG: phenylacetic acid degradation protein [Sphingomonas sp. SCN 67-18]